MNVTAPFSMATIRFLLGGVPAVVAMVFAGVIALLALFLDQQRRNYALQVTEQLAKAATVLVCGGPDVQGRSGAPTITAPAPSCRTPSAAAPS